MLTPPPTRSRAAASLAAALGVVAVALLAGAGSPPTAARAPSPSAAQGAPLARLDWLAGCWERRAGTRLVEEQWMRPRGGTMLGMSRTVRGDSLVEFEHVRIADEQGTLVYHASPSGQRPASFRATSLADTAVIFENPAHDFPQRVIYRRASPDSVIARVEGTRNGTVRGIDFPYRRVACP